MRLIFLKITIVPGFFSKSCIYALWFYFISNKCPFSLIWSVLKRKTETASIFQLTACMKSLFYFSLLKCFVRYSCSDFLCFKMRQTAGRSKHNFHITSFSIHNGTESCTKNSLKANSIPAWKKKEVWRSRRSYLELSIRKKLYWRLHECLSHWADWKYVSF